MLTTWMEANPFSLLDAFDSMNDVLRVFAPRTGGATPFAAGPALNLYESPQGFFVTAEVPGMTEKDLQISVRHDTLEIRGERKARAPEGYEVHRREREERTFSRTVTLPSPVNADDVKATLKNGILTLELPKSKEAMPRSIPVRVG
jgi:HSP20 family protein